MTRPALTIVLELALAIVFTLFFAGVLLVTFGASPGDAFFVQGPQLLFTFMDVGVLAWIMLLILGSVRHRGLGWGVGGTILAALVAVAVNLVTVVVIAFLQGGANLFYIALGFEAGILFFASAVAATLLVHRIFLRPRAT